MEEIKSWAFEKKKHQGNHWENFFIFGWTVPLGECFFLMINAELGLLWWFIICLLVPAGIYIEEILTKWRGDYEKLEHNHTYIQW